MAPTLDEEPLFYVVDEQWNALHLLSLGCLFLGI
jgi:hypothetical protein